MKPATILISLGLGSTFSMAAPTKGSTSAADAASKGFDTDALQDTFPGKYPVPGEPPFVRGEPSPEDSGLEEAEEFASAIGARNLAGGPSHRARIMKRADKCVDVNGDFIDACVRPGWGVYGAPGYGTGWGVNGWGARPGWNSRPAFGAYRPPTWNAHPNWATPYPSPAWNPQLATSWNAPYSATAWNTPNGLQGFAPVYPPYGVGFNVREGPKPHHAMAAAH